MPQFDRLGNDMSDDIADALAWEEMDRQKDERQYMESDELTGYEEHLRDSQGEGDARRCPRHPHVKTSSDDGMFDGECGECEGEADDYEQYRTWKDALALTGPVCEDHGHKSYERGVRCGGGGNSCHESFTPGGVQAALDEYNLTHLELDEIPF